MGTRVSFPKLRARKFGKLEQGHGVSPVNKDALLELPNRNDHRIKTCEEIPPKSSLSPKGVQFRSQEDGWEDEKTGAIVLTAQKEYELSLPGQIYYISLDTSPLHFPPAAALIAYPTGKVLERKIMASIFALDPTQLDALAMAVTPTVPTTIPQGMEIVTLVPVQTEYNPYAKNPLRHVSITPYDQLIEPMEAWFTTKITRQKPILTLTLNGVPFSGLVDTGADVSVIAQDQWPPDWPITSSPAVKGVGGLQMAQASKDYLKAFLPNSTQTASIRPVILPLHVNLWGRDLLSQIGSSISWT